MSNIYLVTGKHPTDWVKFNDEPMTVRKDALDGYYVIHGKLGCGRTRETPQLAIRDICNSHAIEVLSIKAGE